MKPSPLIIVLICFFQAQAQPYFGNYYKNSPTSSYFAIPCIDRCYDGSIIGTSIIDGGPNSFKLFKLAADGTMLWQKRIDLSIPIYTPSQVCALRDSSIAILISPQSGSDFIILKCNTYGQILSVWIYTNTFCDAGFIRPFGHGGVLSVSSWGIVMIDVSGNIVHNYRFNNIEIFSAEEKSPGIFTCVGQQGFPHGDPLLFDIDTAGIVTNAYNYPLLSDSIYGNSDSPSKRIARSPDGGIYCALSLGAYPVQKFLVACFDSINQPVWSRKVEYLDMESRQILADRNNGCIVTADVGQAPYMPAIYKFDSTGTLEWKKLLGDSSNIFMKFFTVFDIIPDSSTGWYYSLEKFDNYIFHSDSIFSTFCATETFQPVITNITPGVVADTLSAIPVTTGMKTALTATYFTQPIYQFDACTGMQVNVADPEVHSFELFPNPASEKVKLEFRYAMQSAHLEIYNSHGALLNSQDVSGLTSAEIALENLPAGIYLFRVTDLKRHMEKKLMIQR